MGYGAILWKKNTHEIKYKQYNYVHKNTNLCDQKSTHLNDKDNNFHIPAYLHIQYHCEPFWQSDQHHLLQPERMKTHKKPFFNPIFWWVDQTSNNYFNLLSYSCSALENFYIATSKHKGLGKNQDNPTVK